MPNSLEQQRLLKMLHDNEVLRERGYEFSILGGVLVEREGHARGLWRCGTRGFSWTPAGYNEPQEWLDDAEQALRYTLFVLAGRSD
jgi:hypothetical protein